MSGVARTKASPLLLLVALLGLVIWSGPANAVADYAITDLGTLGGATASAYGINNRCQVVGTSATASGNTHAFLWQGGVMLDLGTLGGTTSFACGINELGQVVGYSTTASASTHAFLWENGVMYDLGTLGGTDSYAAAINESGQIVGYASVVSGDTHAFLWESDVMQDLGTFGETHSYAYGINDSGQVVVVAKERKTTYDYHAFLWEDGAAQSLDPLGQSAVHPVRGINDLGQVVGNNGRTALLWEDGTTDILGVCMDVSPDALVPSPQSINESSQVVGVVSYFSSQSGGQDFFTATLWQDGEQYALQSLCSGLSGRLEYAWQINDLGQIVGCYGDGYPTRAFLMSPEGIPIPEPTALGLAGLALVAVMRRFRRAVTL